MICPKISKWTNKFPECAQLSFKLKYIFKNPVKASTDKIKNKLAKKRNAEKRERERETERKRIFLSLFCLEIVGKSFSRINQRKKFPPFCATTKKNYSTVWKKIIFFCHETACFAKKGKRKSLDTPSEKMNKH